MEITFTLGVAFDSGALRAGAGEIGNITGGPAKLLNWLESQLGLQQPVVSSTSRAIAYRSCLKQCDRPDQFFHDSFSVDPLGVAKALLGWRDSWYLAGWNGQSIGELGSRLEAISEIEVVAIDRVPLCEGQRVQLVLRALDNCTLSLNVVSCDSLESYPAVWRLLLAKLGIIQTNIEYPLAPVETDLGRVQRKLDEGPSAEKLELNGDGTFLVVEAPSRAISSEWMATNFPALEADNETITALLVEGDAAELDISMAIRGLPKLSVSNHSSSRPVMQVLPLALEMLWAPIDPSHLLEFLVHPVGPLPSKIRRPLAEAVASQPGIGGPAWENAIAQILDRVEDEVELPAKAEKKKRDIAESISYWLECEKYSPLPGAPIGVVTERVAAVKDWINQRVAQFHANDELPADLPIYYRATGQADELIAALHELEGQGEKDIDSDLLRRLVHSVRGEGVARPDIRAEVAPDLASMFTLADPAVFVSAIDSVIWWGADDARSIPRYPWSRAELHQLKLGGVELSNLNEVSERRAESWLRPIRSATKKLLFVVHKDAESQHPVFDHLRSVVKDLPTAELLPHVQGQSNTLLDSYCRYERLVAVSLTRKSRVWTLGSEVKIPKRSMESFSSLESFIYGPYMWVLRYPAKIRAGKILNVSDDNMLKGNLAHQAFEDYFTAFPDIASADSVTAKTWMSEYLRGLLPKQGAVLLRPGRAPERERFLSDVVQAIGTLLEHLKQADVVSVEMETELSGGYVGGEITGRLDLLAHKNDGREAIIDIKWGGARYRQAALEQSKYLQLAIYSALHRQSGGGIPAVGYFIIAQGELLVLNDNYFPSARIVEPENGEALGEFWLRFENSWKQRRAQLDKGIIEVNVTGTEPVADLLFDENGLAAFDVFESFSEFGALVGWEENA